MKIIKLTKSKGFTLIELMIVISIIALLSSIVLSSVKVVREKSLITKTIVEMKNLQQAVELYKTQLGVYPGSNTGNTYDEDIYCLTSCGLYAWGDFENFVKTELVNRKLLAKVPRSPNYPNNNCNSSWELCYNSGYILGYSAFDGLVHGLDYSLISNYEEEYIACDNQRVKNYIIYFYANSKKNKFTNFKFI